MAKGKLSIGHSAFSEMIAELQAFPDILNQAIDAGVKAMGAQAVKDVKASYMASVGGAATSDYVYASLDGYCTTIAEGKMPWVSAGSFEYVVGKGDIRSAFGKTPEDMNPPQIAYWLEHGTQRLVSGAEKPKSVDWSMVDAVDKRQVIQPTSFISRAAINGWNAQQEAFATAFNQVTRG